MKPDLRVVAEASDGAEAVERALAATPTCISSLLDVSMPRMTGLQAAREITRRNPEIRVLMLSMHDNERYFFEALEAGASGYVLKTAADRDVVDACRAAMRGEPFLYPGAVRALVRDYLERARRGETLASQEPLTPRELEIVKLIAEAHTNDEIAEMLVISKKTVERHRANMLEKLGMTRPRRADAVRHPPRADRALTGRPVPAVGLPARSGDDPIAAVAASGARLRACNRPHIPPRWSAESTTLRMPPMSWPSPALWPSASSSGCAWYTVSTPTASSPGSLVAMPYGEAKRFWTRSAPPIASTNGSSNSAIQSSCCSRR